MSAAQQRRTWDIHGGVHPPENKHQSVQTPIKTASIPDTLVFPLSQHIGAPAKPIVSVGDQVLKGQMIAEAGGFVSVPVHASTSGEVIAIENANIIHSSGMAAPAIIVKSDGNDTWADHQGVDDYTQLDKAALVNIVRNAGIAGMGGAGFPSAVKLNTRPDQEIKTLIINGTECEPYITADDILMRERAEQIIEGAKILQHIVQPEEVLIGVEDNKPEGIAALKKAAQGTDVEIVVFPTKYPSGGEKQLIQILTGKEVPAGGLPADIGIVCQNIGTTVAIYKAVTLGEPLISRITTVTGEAIDQQQNYEVLLGTPVNFLLKESGFHPEKAARLIAGGPMMGFAIESDDVPVVKATNCILVPTEQEIPSPPPAQACIRCGMCAEACPVSLLPQQLFWFAQSKNHEGLKDHHLMDCIECGACSFVCPSNIPLVQYYRASKADIRQTEADARKAEYSKERFEARQDRLAKIEEEKERKRIERQQKAAKAAEAKEKQAKDSKANADKDAVQAAIERTKAAKTAPAADAPAADDPVAAAIARAKAKASGEATDPAADAQAKIQGLEKRLEKAKAKLQTAKDTNDENLPAFESSVEKLEAKIAEAKANTPATSTPAAGIPADDPVAAAIARAKAKAAGQDVATDPVEEAKSKIAALEKRLSKAEAKAVAAKESGDENLAAFESSVEKLQAKLADAKAALPAQKPAEETAKEPAAANAPASDDPVAAAIARAQAKRNGGDTDVDPKAKLENDIASLEKRLKASQEKLSVAEADGSDTADAFKSSIEKLQAKLDKAQSELATLTGGDSAAPEPAEEAAAPAADDPIQAAIERAKAKRANADNVDPADKLKQDIVSLEKRIKTTSEKLATAEAEGADTAEVLNSSLSKLKDKLEKAQQELETL